MGEVKQSAPLEPNMRSRLGYISGIGVGDPSYVLGPGKRETGDRNFITNLRDKN